MRFLGVTGHGTRIAGVHLRSLERQPGLFASVLLPFSFVALQDPAYRDDVEHLLDVCADQQVAVQTIKGTARRRWREDDPGRRFSWYEPMTDPDAIGRAVRYVLSHPQLFLNTTSDARVLPTVLDAASRGGDRPSDQELAADVTAHGLEPLFDGGELERI